MAMTTPNPRFQQRSAASPPESPVKRLRALDGLRGLAALVVVFHHSLLSFPELAKPYFSESAVHPRWSFAWWMVETPLHALWEGDAAVYVFFILSGIVLTLPALKMHNFSWTAYYPQRLLRLYLPVWAAVALAALTFLVVPRVGSVESPWLVERVTEITPLVVFKDLTLVTGNGGLATPLWSLVWEVIFSLLLPLYVMTARRFPKLNILKAVVSFAVIFLGSTFGSGILTYLPMFFLGSIIAMSLLSKEGTFSARLPKRMERNWRFTILFGVSLILVTCTWTAREFIVIPRTSGTATAIALSGAVVLVYLSLRWPLAKTLLERPTFQWLGRISFSLYLVHEPIIVSFNYLFGAGETPLALACALPVTFVIAIGFFYGIERPSHRLSIFVRKTIARHDSSKFLKT
jgi:peptidoglycan/LPS O-acetylase OafA/YrhL